MEMMKKDDSRSKIQSYKFVNLDKLNSDGNDGNVRSYEFPAISKENFNLDEREKEERSIDFLSDNSRKVGFNILPIIHEHKGFKQRDYLEKEKRINEEIERRFNLVREEGYKKGYDEGIRLGQKEVYDQTRAATEEKLTTLTHMINEVLSTQEELFKNHKKQIYYLIRNLTKWIICRELRNDSAYLERLLERLLVEMNVRKNLFIQVNKKDFERMPDILEIIQKKMGAIPNVRVEIDPDISANGIVLECDNGIINGTLEQQFLSLDKLFESVGIDDDFFLGKDKVIESADGSHKTEED